MINHKNISFNLMYFAFKNHHDFCISVFLISAFLDCLGVAGSAVTTATCLPDSLWFSRCSRRPREGSYLRRFDTTRERRSIGQYTVTSYIMIPGDSIAIPVFPTDIIVCDAELVVVVERFRETLLLTITLNIGQLYFMLSE